MMSGTLEKDMALEPVRVITNKEKEYAEEKRLWQGIPTITRTKNGSLLAAYYTGGEGEGPYNYVIVDKSSDDGETWSKAIAVIDPPGKVRAFDPCLWTDPLERVWLFWAQSFEWFDGRMGVWASVCSNADDLAPQWSSPKRIANGVMMNKPTVLTTGEWLFPCAVWGYKDADGNTISSDHNCIKEEMFSNVICSTDHGESFTLIGRADIPDRSFDEHMIVERKDGSLWMLVRTHYGIGESISTDRGKTWSPGAKTELGGPDSRFFIRRLNSGNILLVNHYHFEKRNNLTAMLSEDEGITWKGFLLLDERTDVSYPDGFQAPDSRIYITYDRGRSCDKEILFASFTEEDILQEYIYGSSRLKRIISKAG